MAWISAAQLWMLVSGSPSREEVRCRCRCLCELCSPAVDLELTLALPSLAPPQACSVVACNCGLYLFGGAGARRQGVAAADDDGHESLEKGHNGDNNPEPCRPLMIVNNNAESRLNQVNHGRVGEKRRRPVVAAGSQCSRSNGKGWRCNKPAQGGTCHCEEHRNQHRDRCAATRRRRRAAALAKATAAPEAAGI